MLSIEMETSNMLLNGSVIGSLADLVNLEWRYHRVLVENLSLLLSSYLSLTDGKFELITGTIPTITSAGYLK